MRILDLQLRGFRSLHDIAWKPGNLNIVIGPNGSGKSNLLKALELLSQSATGKLSQQINREGGMDSVVFNGPNGIISYKLTSSISDNIKNTPENNLTYQLDLHQIAASSQYKIDYEILGDLSQFDRRFKPRPVIALERHVNSGMLYDEQHHGQIISQEMMAQEESILSSISNPFSANKMITLFQRCLSRWQVYHDFQTHRDAAARQPAWDKNESILTFDGSNLVQVLHTLYLNNREFSNRVDEAMRVTFGQDYDCLSFPATGNQKITLQVNWKSIKRPQTGAMLSDGTLRFLFLLTILANPNPTPLIAIDEPEAGLHPCMLPVLAEYAQSISKRTQVILTTHSEEFLDSFGKYDPTVTIVKIDQGKSRLDVLEGESLRYWMKDCLFHKIYCNEELEALA